MARISDVMTSSRETSPDPITLPSSPLGSHSPRKTRSAATKVSPRKTRRAGTPSKTIVLETPTAGGTSPWRIKVTVEAETREGSPSKRVGRSTTIPLKDETRRSGSPVKRATPGIKGDNYTDAQPRKRKGTPIRGRKARRIHREPETQLESDTQPPAVPETQEEGNKETQHLSFLDRPAPGRLARLSVASNSTRTKRLSLAREELDVALQNAVGYSGIHSNFEAPGDKTVSLNEDFSIISIDSLRSAKEASLANVMHSIAEDDRVLSDASVLKSPGQRVQYPNIEREAADALTSFGDPMSWRPTSKAKDIPIEGVEQQWLHETKTAWQWQQEREAVSERIRNANASDVVDVEEDGPNASDEDPELAEMHDDGADPDDVWQDEASRSLNEDQGDGEPLDDVPAQEDQRTQSPRFSDLFANEPQKPLRSKIPRTWRRSSGMDFSYVDSPAHPRQVEAREDRRHSADGSGVLTPPSTDDGGDSVVVEDEVEEELDSDFQPDAEATRVQDGIDGELARTMQRDEQDAIPLSDSGTSSSSADEKDGGGFFSSNMPSFFSNKAPPRKRPPRQKTMDLTELLNLDGSPVKSPLKESLPHSRNDHSMSTTTTSQPVQSPLQSRPGFGAGDKSPGGCSTDMAVGSSLGKGLLRSNKVPGSSLGRHGRKRLHMAYPQVQDQGEPTSASRNDRGEDTADSSYASKDHDQQPLLNGDTAPRRRGRRARPQHERENAVHSYPDRHPSPETHALSENRHVQGRGDNQQHSYDRRDQQVVRSDFIEASQSYEEQLNLESPTKVRVNFNDSNGSSLLAHRKQYPPLFGGRGPDQVSDARPKSPGIDTLVGKSAKQSVAQPGLLSRLSQTFWSAVVKPTPYPDLVMETRVSAIDFPVELRAPLRQRYGVASEDLPWTMYHMRTLHRMLNSLASNRSDSVVPSDGPLPSSLSAMVNTPQKSVSDYQWVFTNAHAHVVWAFAQILVPQSLIDAMEKGEVEWLGDGMARACRGYYGKDTRHGSQPVWTWQKAAEVGGYDQGKIRVEFIVKAVGAAVCANEMLAEREGLSFGDLQRLGRA